jgi:hypothetical protein
MNNPRTLDSCPLCLALKPSAIPLLNTDTLKSFAPAVRRPLLEAVHKWITP